MLIDSNRILLYQHKSQLILRPYLGLLPKALILPGFRFEIRLVQVKIALDIFKQARKTLFKTISIRRETRTKSELNSTEAKQ